MLEVLSDLSRRYVGESRAAKELHTKLQAIEHERERWLDSRADADFNRRAQGELAEIERVRKALARSSASSTARARAYQALIAAIADVVDELPETPAPPPAVPEALPEATAGPMVRGSWSPVWNR